MSDLTEDEFADIRPYEGRDFSDALNRLLDNKELISLFRKQIFPRMPGFFSGIVDNICHRWLKKYLGKVQNADELHRRILLKLINCEIKKTISGFSSTGIENLEAGKHYLYISNHRDIALDPVIIDYMGVKRGFPSFQVAFGDNLMGNQTVTDAIRMNKAFIVKRNVTPMEQLKASMQLSKYIKTVIDTKDSIWIAQREGRAKDGDDKTNPAIIKMFALCNRHSGLTFTDFINNLNIVPVSVSYELDPCDKLKAREAARKEEKAFKNETYVKHPGEDRISIILGLKGKKGHVHVAYGKPLWRENWRNAKEVADVIDEFVISNYKLWPCNYLAFDIVNSTDKYSDKYTEKYKKEFLSRFDRLSKKSKKFALNAYAKPVENAELYEI